MDLLANRLRVYDAQGELSEEDTFTGFVRNDMFLAQTRHFLECLASGERPVVDLTDGVQSLRLALAALKSLKAQREVRLDEVMVDE